jgi:hypothetical protein
VGFSVPELLAAAAIAAAAGVVRGITGFGGAMVMAPPLALLLGPAVAVPVVLALESIAAAPMLVQTRREVRWPLVGPMLAGSPPHRSEVTCSSSPSRSWARRAIAAIAIVFAAAPWLALPGRQRTGTSVRSARSGWRCSAQRASAARR